MLKKIILYLLILSVMKYTGCYSIEAVSKDAAFASNEPLGEIYVITENYDKYQFGKNSYHIKEDTLYGKGLKILLDNKIPFNGKIPVNEIKYFEVEEVDAVATTGLILGVGALVGIILVINKFGNVKHKKQESSSGCTQTKYKL
jgi:hypothetical protein